jgi:hypothetical protein
MPYQQDGTYCRNQFQRRYMAVEIELVGAVEEAHETRERAGHAQIV